MFKEGKVAMEKPIYSESRRFRVDKNVKPWDPKKDGYPGEMFDRKDSLDLSTRYPDLVWCDITKYERTMMQITDKQIHVAILKANNFVHESYNPQEQGDCRCVKCGVMTKHYLGVETKLADRGDMTTSEIFSPTAANFFTVCVLLLFVPVALFFPVGAVILLICIVCAQAAIMRMQNMFTSSKAEVLKNISSFKEDAEYKFKQGAAKAAQSSLQAIGATMILALLFRRVWKWLHSERQNENRGKVDDVRKTYEILCACMGGYLMLKGRGMEISSTIKSINNWWQSFSAMGGGVASMFGGNAEELFEATDRQMYRMGMQHKPRRRRQARRWAAKGSKSTPVRSDELKGNYSEGITKNVDAGIGEMLGRSNYYNSTDLEEDNDDEITEEQWQQEISNQYNENGVECENDTTADERRYADNFEPAWERHSVGRRLNSRTDTTGDDEEMEDVDRPIFVKPRLNCCQKLFTCCTRRKRKDYNVKVQFNTQNPPMVIKSELENWEGHVKDYKYELRAYIQQRRMKWCCGQSDVVDEYIRHVVAKHRGDEVDSDLRRACHCYHYTWSPNSFIWTNDIQITHAAMWFAPMRENLRQINPTHDMAGEFNTLDGTVFGKLFDFRKANPKVWGAMLVFSIILTGAVLYLLTKWYRKRVTVPTDPAWAGQWERDLQAIGGYQFVAYDELAIVKSSVFPVFSDAQGQNIYCQATLMEDGLYTITHTDPGAAAPIYLRYVDAKTSRLDMIKIIPGEWEIMAASKEGFLLRVVCPKELKFHPVLKWKNVVEVKPKMQAMTVMSFPKLVLGHGTVLTMSETECSGDAPTTFGFCGGPWLAPDISVLFIHFWGETSSGGARIKNGGLRPGMWTDGLKKPESTALTCKHAVTCMGYTYNKKGPCNVSCGGHHCVHLAGCIPKHIGMETGKEPEACCSQFFHRGKCDRADCQFEHIAKDFAIQTARGKDQRQLCFAFATRASCRHGDECKFSHQEFGPPHVSRKRDPQVKSWVRVRKMQESNDTDRLEAEKAFADRVKLTKHVLQGGSVDTYNSMDSTEPDQDLQDDRDWGDRALRRFGPGDFVERDDDEELDYEPWMAQDGPTNMYTGSKKRKGQGVLDFTGLEANDGTIIPQLNVKIKRLHEIMEEDVGCDLEALIQLNCPYKTLQEKCVFHVRKKCPFEHNFKKDMQQINKMRATISRKRLPCQFGRKCKDKACLFLHPQLKFRSTGDPTNFVKVPQAQERDLGNWLGSCSSTH